jgi:hypothetical protein
MINSKRLKQCLCIALMLSSGMITTTSAQTPSVDQAPKTGETQSVDQPTHDLQKVEPILNDQVQEPILNDQVQEPAQPTGPPPPPPTANMECSPKPVSIAAPVTCVVTITHPKTMTVKVNAPPGAENGVAALPQPTQSGELVTKRLFTLRQIELNKPLRIKNVQVSWSAVGGHEGVVKLTDQKIVIRSMLMGISDPVSRDFSHPLGKKMEAGADEASLNNARQEFWLRHAPPSLMEPNLTLIIILGIIGVSTLGIFIGWVIRKWVEVRARNQAPYVDPRPAHVIAFEALTILEEARLIEDGAFKIYSHRLSEIMRAYFGKRYDFNGLEMTSDELREALNIIDLNDETYLVLEDFLSDTDLIKFADFSTSAQALEESKSRVYRLIDLTKIEVEVEVESETESNNDVTTNKGERTHPQEQYKGERS